MDLAGILFDKDGTFVDFDKTWGEAGYQVMRSMSADDATFDRAVEAMHYDREARRFRLSSPLIAGALDELVPVFASIFARENDPTLLDDINRSFADATLQALAPLGRPSDVMQALHARGLKLGLATNDTEASGRAHVSALGLDGLLDFFAGYDTGHGAKPDAGMVLAFARHLGVTPERIMMVGDSVHDLHAARNAGAIAVAVLTGPAPRAMLEPLADHVLDGIADLPALVDRLGGEAASAQRP